MLAAAAVDVRQERATEERREARAAAELARATVHLSARVEGTGYAADSAGWLQALVRIDDDGTVGYADRVAAMRLSGRPHDLLLPVLAPDLPGEALAACDLPDPLQR